MNKRAFTLAEVLGVIIILGLLVIVSFPPLLNQLKKSQDKLSDATLKILGTAAENYIEDHPSTNPIVTNNVYCINLKTLVDGGYLKSPILDASSGEQISELDYDIEFTINGVNQYEYELKDTATGSSSDKCVETKQ